MLKRRSAGSALIILSLIALSLFCTKSPFDTSTELGQDIIKSVDSTMLDPNLYLDRVLMDIPVATASSSLPNDSFKIRTSSQLLTGKWTNGFGITEKATAYAEWNIDTSIFKGVSAARKSRTSFYKFKVVFQITDTAFFNNTDSTHKLTIRGYLGARNHETIFPDPANVASILTKSSLKYEPTKKTLTVAFETDDVSYPFANYLRDTLLQFSNKIGQAVLADTLIAHMKDSIAKVGSRIVADTSGISNAKVLDSLTQKQLSFSTDSTLFVLYTDSLSHLNLIKTNLIGRTLSFFVECDSSIISLSPDSGAAKRPILVAYSKEDIRADTSDTTEKFNYDSSSIGTNFYDYYVEETQGSPPANRAYTSVGSGRRAVLTVNFAPLFRSSEAKESVDLLSASLGFKVSEKSGYMGKDSLSFTYKFTRGSAVTALKDDGLGDQYSRSVDTLAYTHLVTINTDTLKSMMQAKDALGNFTDTLGYITFEMQFRGPNWGSMVIGPSSGGVTPIEALFAHK